MSDVYKVMCIQGDMDSVQTRPQTQDHPGQTLHILVQRGAGSYEVGEETALIECMEGSRGNPRQRPPFPAIRGLYQKPTVVNNVETLCNVPHIVINGGAWFAGIGAPSCPGTKYFSLCGNVARPGNYELPMGTTFRELIFGPAGGVPNGRQVQAIMLGAAPPMISNSAGCRSTLTLPCSIR